MFSACVICCGAAAAGGLVQVMSMPAPPSVPCLVGAWHDCLVGCHLERQAVSASRLALGLILAWHSTCGDRLLYKGPPVSGVVAGWLMPLAQGPQPGVDMYVGCQRFGLRPAVNTLHQQQQHCARLKEPQASWVACLSLGGTRQPSPAVVLTSPCCCQQADACVGVPWKGMHSLTPARTWCVGGHCGCVLAVPQTT